MHSNTSHSKHGAWTREVRIVRDGCGLAFDVLEECDKDRVRPRVHVQARSLMRFVRQLEAQGLDYLQISPRYRRAVTEAQAAAERLWQRATPNTLQLT